MSKQKLIRQTLRGIKTELDFAKERIKAAEELLEVLRNLLKEDENE